MVVSHSHYFYYRVQQCLSTFLVSFNNSSGDNEWDFSFRNLEDMDIEMDSCNEFCSVWCMRKRSHKKQKFLELVSFL